MGLSLHPATNPDYGGEKENGAPLQPLTIENTLRYTSPSLIIDGRENEEVIHLASGNWTFFTVPSVTPGSTAFVTDNDTVDRFTIHEAVDHELIGHHGIVYQKNSFWYYRSDVSSISFEPNVQYTIKAIEGSLTFSILTPSLNYPWERATQDILRGTSTIPGLC
ncbi:MAG: hypothetical protein KZQ92_20625 [Candidatus Thiodiazotropha sp. (ex Lucinoma borealis)]|nr:hypothetical protein [Candidatus Thiodiazotropha sp. (ex Lucinoma borealis)]MCU7866369.1 hypothetical protein [Candidatus Thiodiazotropha sp. (ex Lucinoma borealis)]